MAAQADYFDLEAAPMKIGKVRLKVRNLAGVSAFYRKVLGLKLTGEREGTHALGTSSQPLLELEADPALAPRDPHAAGLFHTAFLLPSRADLARWLIFASENRIRIEGASNHIVSEAIYLSDPEGNGIEIYADRPQSGWRAANGEIHMATRALDAQDLISEAGGKVWEGFPEGGSVGHVHLQVGDTGEAEGFYRDVLGFEVTSHYPGASFFGSGGYHHQLAANVWNSGGAGPRPAGMAGLAGIELVVADASKRADIVARAKAAGLDVTAQEGATALHDPWGTVITLAA